MKKIGIILGLILVIATGAIGFYVYQRNTKALKYILLGDQYYRDGKYQESLIAYQQADDVKASAEAKLRIALAQKALTASKTPEIRSETSTPTATQTPAKTPPEGHKKPAQKKMIWIREGQVNDIEELMSQFLEKLKKENYKEAPETGMTPTFRWDFSEKGIHTYSYEQELRSRTKGDMETDSEGTSGSVEQSLSAKGNLVLKIQGDGTATLILQDMKTSVKMKFDNGEEPKTIEQTMPPLVVQGMQEDGSGAFGDSSQDMFLKLLFPLPPKTLTVGESVDVPAQMPFHAMGSLLQVTGRSRITLTRYVKIGQRTCAELDVDINISELNIPSELEGKYTCSTRGASVLYFDIANRRFVSGAVAILMQISMDAPMPKMNTPGEDMPEMPERIKMSLMNDSLIRVTLRE